MTRELRPINALPANRSLAPIARPAAGRDAALSDPRVDRRLSPMLRHTASREMLEDIGLAFGPILVQLLCAGAPQPSDATALSRTHALDRYRRAALSLFETAHISRRA